MARKKQDAYDPFEILNSEFGTSSAKSRNRVGTSENRTAEQNKAGSENRTAEQNTEQNKAATVHRTAEQNKAGSENRTAEQNKGVLGWVVKTFFTLGLAAALAWIIFMPSGSMRELGRHLTAQVMQAVSGSDLPLDFTHTSATTANTTTTTANRTAEQNTTTLATTATTVATTVATTTTTAKTTSTTAKTTSTTAKTTSTTAKRTAEQNTAEQNTAEQNTAEQNNQTDNEVGYINVYLKSQIVIAYDKDGKVRKAFTCSSGKASTPTRTGNYTIHSKYRWRLMIGNCYTQYASSFSSGYLFHSIPYNRRNAATMSNASYDKLGTPASSGCIRLCFRDSKWIYDNCPIGTSVRVLDEEAPANTVTEPILPRIIDTAHSGWDPTDTAENNPYH